VVIRRALVAILARRTGRIWLEAGCGCAWTVDPVQVLVCYGHRHEQERITKGFEAIFAGGAG
jgi:hypothetical protein